MRKNRVPQLVGGLGWQAQAMSVLRPSVEAVLLAGVALGCAQLGWQAIAPQSADASGSEAPSVDLTPLSGETQSPFAPLAGSAADAHQTAAAVSGLKLAGVRMAKDASRSGAVLTLEGGDQRAFLVGQEVAAGVRLVSVNANSVVLGYSGGETQLALAAAPATQSYAMALMGKAPSPSLALSDVSTSTSLASAPSEQGSAPTVASAPAPFASAPVPTPAASDTGAKSAQLVPLDQPAMNAGAAWVAATLAQPRIEGETPGWRVASPIPEAARALGIQEGDVVMGVNGGEGGDPTRLLAAAKGGPLVLDVQRASGERVSVTVGTQTPS